MKFATIMVNGRNRVARVAEGRLPELLEPEICDLADLAAYAGLSLPFPSIPEMTAALEHLKLLAPIPRPRRNVFCVGKNYHDHALEFSKSGFDSSAASGAIPSDPIIFSKVPESVIAHNEVIRFDPGVSNMIDYEGELAVIIGKGGKGIRRADAMMHVWGYTIINDVTARDVQNRLKQWHVGKSFDSFCPMGPCAVTADELDLTDTTLRTWVNGELRQQANTRDLIFDVPAIIETLSAGITLYPGDVIATGTPAGVGIGFSPPKYLVDGDVVTIEISCIGKLENRVRTVNS
jgi:2-keto-4-pentenoate hydratase/2-oxohepta-3-ene-1,7-dioic acid hydratase in catechol pathway